ncbi:MAG: hypothetical protein WCI02_17480 [Planctomycetota bacterium]
MKSRSHLYNVSMTLFLVAACNLVLMPSVSNAFDHREELEKHQAAVREGALEVAARISDLINENLQNKDYAAAADLNRALIAFLGSKTYPASLIPDKDIAETFALKRKASARNVFQQFRQEMQGTSFQSDDLKAEMEEFVQSEIELQKIPEWRDSSLPKKKDSQPKDNQPEVKNKVKTGVLDARETEKLFEAVEEAHQKRLDATSGASTTLERTRLSEKASAEATREISNLLEGKTITLDCELIDSTPGPNRSFPYVVFYRLLNFQNGKAVQEYASERDRYNRSSRLNLPPELKELGESKKGTRFRVVCELKLAPMEHQIDESNPNPNAQQFFRKNKPLFWLDSYKCCAAADRSKMQITLIDDDSNQNEK